MSPGRNEAAGAGLLSEAGLTGLEDLGQEAEQEGLAPDTAGHGVAAAESRAGRGAAVTARRETEAEEKPERRTGEETETETRTETETKKEARGGSLALTSKGTLDTSKQH